MTRGREDSAREDKLRNLAASAGRARGGRVDDARTQAPRARDSRSQAPRTQDSRSQASYSQAPRAEASQPRQRTGRVRAGGHVAAPQDRGRATRGNRSSLAEFARRNIGYIASVAVVVALVTGGIIGIRAFLPASPQGEDTPSPGYVSPYDWTKLDRSDGRYRYFVDGEAKSRLGVDVSENQQAIDWQAVAADGIEFAIIRVGYRGATEGGLYLDGRFYENLEGARDAGLACGVYFFSQANTAEEAAEEADFVLEQLNGTTLEYPVAFDSEVVNLKDAESPTASLSQDEMTAIANAFCTRIAEAGYKPLLYGNYIDLARYHLSDLHDVPIWWAEYGSPAPTAKLTMDIWQYSSGGKVAGISTVVDLDIDLRGVLAE